jgi:hypothetical protein
VKEFSVFSVQDVKAVVVERGTDFLRIDVAKGALKMSAKVELRAGYPVTPPLWHLTL